MKRLDLNGEWQFRAIDKYRALPNNKKYVGWMKASVPGTVHTDLLANARIPDPFFRLNELDVQWIDSVQWLYRKEFHVDGTFLNEPHVFLVAEGLDTYATVRLNGKDAAETSNMFVEHRLNVRRFLVPAMNRMEILFDSPVRRSRTLEEKHGKLDVALESHRVYVRKAQYSFGWDWGPKLTTSGIWRNIFLEAYSRPFLVRPFVKVISASNRDAILQVSVEVEGVMSDKLAVRVAITSEECHVVEKRNVHGRAVTAQVHIRKPRLWWPNGLGPPSMYLATITLVDTSEEVHELSIPFGIRTIRLLREKDAEGESFVFEINGVRVFCKGADWIPCDSFIPRIRDTTYEKLLTKAKDAHMNMLRVWGGGIYEQDIFYNLCDRLGLMVWQDFMFACAEYPQKKWFLKQVEEEAKKVVTRLRNHPSLVLWCGNNECEWIFCAAHPGKTPDDMSGAVIFRNVIPRIVRELDDTRPFWRSSPFGKGFPNDESNGNRHQWKVWSLWKDYQEYENDKGRFLTEFGFQSPAHSLTFNEVTIPSDRTPQSEVMEHHNKQVEGTERLFRFQAAHFQLGKDFDDFVYKGQLVQAEALKHAVEHWRQRKFKTAGALFWQLNDCWPVTSWSVIDSRLRPKAAYYYAREFFAPILVSFKKSGESIEVWGTNDDLHTFQGILVLSHLSVEGKKFWLKKKNIRLSGNSSALLHRIRQTECPQTERSVSYILAQLKSKETVTSENRFFFVEPKHFDLPRSSVKTELKQVGLSRYELKLKAEKFVKNVRVEIFGQDADFDRNYFDIDSGGVKSVFFVAESPMSNVKRSLRIHWLNI